MQININNLFILYLLNLTFILGFSFSFQLKVKGKGIRIKKMTFLKNRKTCFPDDDEEINKYSKVMMNNIQIDSDYYSVLDFEKPLYTLIWYDCDKCRKLLANIKSLDLKHIYINSDDINDINCNFQSPLLYKDDLFIGDTLFDIYKEIYKEKG
jgi:hypothetical protein